MRTLTWWRVLESKFGLEQTSRENWTMALTESPRSGAGDSINSSNISKAIIAISSSPEAMHCLETFKMLGINSRNLICMHIIVFMFRIWTLALVYNNLLYKVSLSQLNKVNKNRLTTSAASWVNSIKEPTALLKALKLY